MTLTDASLRNPAAVAVAVVLVCAFGLLSLGRLPLQLFPDIERPQMSVQSAWRAASPQEMESEIVEPIETVLQGLPGLEEIASNVNSGNATINLTFAVGSDMDAMLVEVLARMNRLPPLPRDAVPPVVRSGSDDANNSLTYFFVQQLPGTAGDIVDYRQFIEDRIVPRLTAIDGVAGVDINGGTPEELTITLDLARAASLGIGVPDVAAVAARATDASGGVVEAGRREYVLRFAGRYSPDALDGLILAWREGRPVRLADVATVEVRRPQQRFFAYQNGNPAIGLRILRTHDANVLATLDEVKRVVADVREQDLRPLGLDIAQSFDASVFIHRAIGLLSGSLLAGVLLAVGCLWWFLRDLRATALIACAIPICLLATFIVLQLTGRSLNVISLAGLAFAVGMVMDAAVVVAENIVRLRETGMPAARAALEGTRQVGGALFASTLTTVAVFVPVIFMRDVEGQLFADLALTISIAVGLSLLVALTVLPAAAGRWLRPQPGASAHHRAWSRIGAWALGATRTRRQQLGWVGALVLGPVLATAALLPQIDYLPPVKRAAVDAFFTFPPGMSPELVNREIVPVLLERMRPYMDGERAPQLSNWYVNLWPGAGSLGARVVDPDDIGELERIVRDEVVTGLPDTRAFASEGELFGGFGGSPRAIAIHLQHGDGDALAAAAEAGRQALSMHFPGANVQAWPNADAGTPELRVAPDDRRLAEAGWQRSELATVVRALGDGQWLGEYFDGDRRLAILLRGARQDGLPLEAAPLSTPAAGVLALGELARVDTVLAPNQLRRIDRRRTLTLTVDPPPAMSLEQALEIVDGRIVPALREALPADASIRVAGSADRLDQVVGAMGANFAMALGVLFLLLAAMFRSLRDSAFVMATLPMAVFGGVLGLRALDLAVGQTLDLLSMIGFILLLGMVINNAILLVAQAREAQAAGATLDDALRQALDQRLRPILIAALTGVLGALPMAINPGPGAVIYRGLAAVSVGGVALSLVFTVVLVPALMRLADRRPRPAPDDLRDIVPLPA
ncbi:efflux RND transporter permease subunit [Luteimonas sp. M1R5S18]|uniref:Efflux RND transporter permease subunit n=1 Tax=Luteimonas rhizosphaericola TaxID=3042024 RepID=A0ABT6JFG5_9GAMM|nr:efflux RND transporter permease subunit [Luteimonas rhizosphaericola]MDH5829414.1 efflux RND transporter permease subunit [Luteimonas rhizosphaericola]